MIINETHVERDSNYCATVSCAHPILQSSTSIIKEPTGMNHKISLESQLCESKKESPERSNQAIKKSHQHFPNPTLLKPTHAILQPNRQIIDTSRMQIIRWQLACHLVVGRSPIPYRAPSETNDAISNVYCDRLTRCDSSQRSVESNGIQEIL